MADKKKRQGYNGPAGIAVFPKLRTFDTKFNADGEWGTKVAYDPNSSTFQAFAAFLDAETDKAFAEMKEEQKKFAKQMVRNSAYVPETDKEGNETGRVVVNFKRPCLIKRKSDGKVWKLSPPVVFDAKGIPLPAEQDVGGGSTIKPRFEISPYFVASTKGAGISLRLVAVQVLDLKQWNGAQDASSYGFGEEEGYSFGDVEEAVSSTPAAAGSTNDDF